MFKQILQTQTTAAAAEPTDTPTVTHYDQLAAQVDATLTALLAPIGTLETSHPATRDAVRVNASVDDKFILAVLGAITETPSLQGLPFDVAQARDLLQLQTAFRPVADKLIALGSMLHFTMDARKASVVTAGRHVYLLAKRMAEPPQGAAIRPFVQVMQRELGRRRPKKKAAPTTPDPMPQTDPTTPEQKKEVPNP